VAGVILIGSDAVSNEGFAMTHSASRLVSKVQAPAAGHLSSPNGQRSRFATDLATKRPENGRNSTTISERRRRAKHFLLFALAITQPSHVTANKPSHNPKVAGSNPVPATNTELD
jgi:hypothetical protein